jgi:ubiquinol-cytochrome c reductase cytochrome b subunit
MATQLLVHYGSSGIIILLVLHIGQTIIYGSYKGRRELLWLSGCILLALMLGMAFTG